MTASDPKPAELVSTPHRHIFRGAPTREAVDFCQACRHEVEYTDDWAKLGPNGSPRLSDEGRRTTVPCTYPRPIPEGVLPRCPMAASEDTLAAFPKLRAEYGGATEPGNLIYFGLERFADFGLPDRDAFAAVWEELAGRGLAEPTTAPRTSWKLTEMGLMPGVLL